MINNSINISQIMELAERYAAGQLQSCLQEALGNGSNACLALPDQVEGISILSMACFVRGRMEQEGVPVSRALRILGQRMRGLAEESPNERDR
jgi:hypothetical protein